MTETQSTPVQEVAARPARTPGWVLVVLGVMLVAILVVGAATLYLVSEIRDQGEEVADTKKTVTATKAVVDVVAARQLENQQIPAKVESAVGEITRLLTETQEAIDATNEAVAATNQTLDETNALIAQAEAAAAKAQQSATQLQTRLGALQQNQGQLATTIETELGRVRARLTSIESRLKELGPR